MQLYPGWSARDNYVSGPHTVGEPSRCQATVSPGKLGLLS